MGLKEVVQTTMELFPEGLRAAFAAAQKADLALKRKTSERIVTASAASAAAIGATPLPFADAALLLPVQVGMLDHCAECIFRALLLRCIALVEWASSPQAVPGQAAVALVSKGGR